MPSRFMLLIVCVAATACHDSPVAPVSPPEGLTVSLREVNALDALSPSLSPVVVARGDSVMLTAALGGMGCVDVRTTAGLSNGQLVVTITSRPLGAETVCEMGAGIRGFRAVVRPAPAGRYTAVLRQRFEAPPREPQEQEVVRAAVVVP